VYSFDALPSWIGDVFRSEVASHIDPYCFYAWAMLILFISMLLLISAFFIFCAKNAEHAASELNDFKAWFDILSHRCPDQEVRLADHVSFLAAVNFMTNC